ncbi:MAG TPA: penicillin-binding protein 2 [Verrucomicrobiae bacterium]|nr:penicillin-binding protein 2 [Verrucomicrobiae bacterium]
MSPRARVGILIGVMGLMTLALVGRIFSIAVLSHDSYLAKAKEQQQVERDILPRRGSLYVQDASNGTSVVVAQSIERFALSATPKNVIRKEEYARVLSQISGVEEARLRSSFDKSGWYMEPFMHNLDKSQVEEIAQKIWEIEKAHKAVFKPVNVNFDSAQGDVIHYLGGVFFVREYERVYPETALLGQVLGFVNDKGKGQYGFEGQYDAELKGYAGRVSLEQDSRGTALKEFQQVDGQDGTSYELTIDRNVQQVVEQELKKQVEDSEAKSGSVIVMDPKTGGIIAMANYPSYAPAEFRNLGKDQIGLFDNPSISSVWEPGSIFKPLIMSGALDQGLVTPNTTDVFGASVNVDGYTITTALDKAFGKESMTDVLTNSDNVAMVWLGEKMGNTMMGDYLSRFGFGSQTGIDLKNEISGKVNPPQRWSNILRATTTFGQGIAVTPLQITSAYASIANNGVLMQPHVVKAAISSDGVRTETKVAAGKQVLKPQTATDMRNMLTAVVVHNHKRAGVEGYKVGGKTGTAQVPDPDKPGYIENAYNHSFAGMAPADDPRYVMLVKIDQPNLEKVGRFAEGTAVPLFGRISRFLLHYYQIPPTNK